MDRMGLRESSWLSEEEIVYSRMQAFHRDQVAKLESGGTRLGKREDGYLIIHLIPHSAVRSRVSFEGAKLLECAVKLRLLGAAALFNVDGLVKFDRTDTPESYVQIYRDGRLEAASTAITYTLDAPTDKTQYLRDSYCEKCVFDIVREYFNFCTAIGLEAPVTLFSALVACQGTRYDSRRRYENAIDRSPAILPEIEFTSFPSDVESALRPWCDLLFQAMGFESSPNFDGSGKWQGK